MFKALSRLFGGGASPADQQKDKVAAGLILEAVRMDNDFDDAERQAIYRTVQDRFGLSQTEVDELLAAAEKAPRVTYDDNEFLSRIHEHYDEKDKVALVEMLWEVALADGELHRFENHAILAIANRFGMGQAQIDATKAAAKARLSA